MVCTSLNSSPLIVSLFLKHRTNHFKLMKSYSNYMHNNYYTIIIMVLVFKIKYLQVLIYLLKSYLITCDNF